MLGTGAFSRVESNRNVTVQVAEDAHAYLGLKGHPDSPNSSYTNVTDTGHLEVDMSPSNPTQDADGNDLGEGVNSNSQSWFADVFQICNQGKEDAYVWIEKQQTEGAGAISNVTFYDTDQADVGEDPADENASIMGEMRAIEVPVGECLDVGIYVDTRGITTQFNTTLLEEVVVVADVG